MKDFLGNELSVGDKCVARIPNGRNADYLAKVEVVGFTEKQVRINRKDTSWRPVSLTAGINLVKVEWDG